MVVSGLGLPVTLPFTRLSKVSYLPPLSTLKSPPFSPIPAACGYRAVLQPHLESFYIFISGVPHNLSKRPRKLCQLSHSLPMSILEGSKAQIPTRLSPPPTGFKLLQETYRWRVDPWSSQIQEKTRNRLSLVSNSLSPHICVGPLPCRVPASMTGHAVRMAYHLLICPSLVPCYYILAFDLVSFPCPHDILGKL